MLTRCGDPDIADVMPLTDRSLYVLGKKLGTTNVSIYDAGKQLIGSLPVEKHRCAVFARKSRHTPLQVDGGREERLFLVPVQLARLFR